jgi:hypothetical protein
VCSSFFICVSDVHHHISALSIHRVVLLRRPQIKYKTSDFPAKTRLLFERHGRQIFEEEESRKDTKYEERREQHS